MPAPNSWPVVPEPTEATAQLPPVTRASTSLHTAPTVSRLRNQRPPRSAPHPSPVQLAHSTSKPTATAASMLAISPKFSLRLASMHPKPPGLRALKAYRTKLKRNTKPPVEGKWVFIPKQRDLTRSEPIRLTLDETAPPSCLTPQATAASMVFLIIARYFEY